MMFCFNFFGDWNEIVKSVFLSNSGKIRRAEQEFNFLANGKKNLKNTEFEVHNVTKLTCNSKTVSN